MAQKLRIEENQTHWKSSDVRRIVRLALGEAGADLLRKRTIFIKWCDGSRVQFRFWPQPEMEHATLRIFLPKRGPKVDHHSPLIALAGAAVAPDVERLALSDSFFLANALAFEFAKAGKTDQMAALRPMKRSTNPPGWADADSLVITKYADPAKDGTYRDFVAKKERAIENAQERVDKWEAEEQRAKKNAARARRDLKNARKSLVEAKKRRGIR